jgi:molecular chaperone GrpE
MPDSPKTVDRSKTGPRLAADGQPEREAAAEREVSRQEQARAEGTSAPEQSHSPGGAPPGDDGRHAAPAGKAPARDADEDALRGDVDELVAVAAQRDEYLALAQRTQADFENYRKRVAKELNAAQERGMSRLAEELLPALDNLDRALEEAAAAAEREGREDPLLEGFRLVRSELRAALAQMGIECFSPKGAVFDPAEHEAMAQQPVPGAQSGTVVEVFQPGYRLGKSIIRPARVLVAA